MILKYIYEGKNLETDLNNDYVEIISELKDNKEIIKIKALKDISLISAEINKKINITKDDLIFLNGYQSWTETKDTYIFEKERNIKKAPKGIVKKFGLDRYGDSFMYEYDKDVLHGFDIFYIKGKESLFSFNNNYNNAYLIYKLNKKTNSLTLRSDIYNINLSAGEEFVVFDYYLYNDYNEGLNKFNDVFKKKNLDKIFGYTSWYNYYQDINENIILRDLDAIDYRFNLFQIDDGYETFVGDWMDVDKNKFPNGLKAIVDKIHSKGLKAGIWLAPFVAETKSKIYQEHQDLLKKDKNGNLVSCGGNWSGFYLLDFENEEAKNYMRKSLEFFMDLGFDFFKLDFLYASCLEPIKGMTRCQTQNYTYNFLKEVLKDKIILGCGANVINCYNNFDYLRIGPDVSLKFDDVWFMRGLHRERISTKITLQNTIYRSFLNDRLFGNDPDVFLLRDNNISLSNKQKEALITINALFGNVLMTSDNIADYDEEKKKLLSNAFDIYYHSKVLGFERRNDEILIKYELNGKVNNIIYNTKKGVLING